jgi:threonine aldolase
MTSSNRRDFLKATGLAAMPLLTPFSTTLPSIASTKKPVEKLVNFVFDGEVFLNPKDYVNKLSEIVEKSGIHTDFYGNGGAVTALEEKFTALTGKEKALFMPTGTMANEVALRVLSEDGTKIFVQETSHVYRDEADAAQSIHSKRLIPLSEGKANFTLQELKDAIDYYNKEESFKSGIGAVSIENPVRRCDGQVFDFTEMKKIHELCRSEGYKMHLDGARLQIASAFTGVSIKDYSSLFDTIYISLYKYLGAAGGAILCGPAAVIDKVAHLRKMLGGTIIFNWPAAAVALHTLEGFSDRMDKTIKQWENLSARLNTLPGLKIDKVTNGSNVYKLKLDARVDPQKLSQHLKEKANIWLAPNKDNKEVHNITVNETLLYQDNERLYNSFAKALQTSLS